MIFRNAVRVSHSLSLNEEGLETDHNFGYFLKSHDYAYTAIQYNYSQIIILCFSSSFGIYSPEKYMIMCFLGSYGVMSK